MLFNVQYNLNYSYFRKIKRPSVLLEFIIISNLITIFRTVADIYAAMTYQKVAEETTAYKMCEKMFAWLLCMETLALNILHLQ